MVFIDAERRLYPKLAKFTFRVFAWKSCLLQHPHESEPIVAGSCVLLILKQSGGGPKNVYFTSLDPSTPPPSPQVCAGSRTPRAGRRRGVFRKSSCMDVDRTVSLRTPWVHDFYNEQRNLGEVRLSVDPSEVPCFLLSRTPSGNCSGSPNHTSDLPLSQSFARVASRASKSGLRKPFTRGKS